MANDLIGTSTRRRLLGVAAGATGVALAATVLHPAQAAAAVPGVGPSTRSAGGGPQSFSGGRTALELGGVSQGYVRSADGGDAFADVIVEAGGLKHLGLPKLEDFSVEFGFDLGLDFYLWIVGAVGGGEQEGKDGVVLRTDVSRNVKSARAFQQAHITELVIPACDVASKNPGNLTLSFEPGQASDITRSGTLAAAAAQKSWLPSNFKLQIDDLDCTKVAKIDSITMKRNTADPSRFDYSNLGIVFSASTLATWQSWFNDFVVGGLNGQDKERNGRLTLLASNGVTELAVLQLHKMGIYRLDPDNEPPAGADAVQHARAELYVEAMNFSTLGPYILT